MRKKSAKKAVRPQTKLGFKEGAWGQGEVSVEFLADLAARIDPEG
jgi:hypothetical protein